MARAPKEKPFVPPKTIGACADMLYALKAERTSLNHQAAAIEAKEKAIKEHVINTLPKGDTGAFGKVAKVVVVTKEVPKVDDWEAVYKYIKKTGDFSLLQRRLSEEAIKERWESKKQVPGVSTFTAVTISLTKV